MEKTSEFLVRLAQNDYMIDSHFLADGGRLMEAASAIAELRAKIEAWDVLLYPVRVLTDDDRCAVDAIIEAARAVVGEQSGGIQSQEDNCKPAPEKEGG